MFDGTGTLEPRRTRRHNFDSLRNISEIPKKEG